MGVGNDGNAAKEDGGLYANKFRGMNNGTDARSEMLLVNEEEAAEKLPPNMPNYDPFLEAETKRQKQFDGPPI